MIDWMELFGYPMPGEVLVWILIFLAGFLFTLQIYHWIGEPPIWPGIILALIVGIGTLVLVTQEIPLIPAVMNASIYGIYGIQGRIYILAVVALVLTMLFNAFGSWIYDRKLEVLR